MTRHPARYARAARLQVLRRRAQPNPVPGRITMALDLRGLYGPDVDRACGVEEPTVDRWETGEVVPTREQMHALVLLTGYPLIFFYQPLPPLGRQFLCADGGCDIIDIDGTPPAPLADVIGINSRGAT